MKEGRVSLPGKIVRMLYTDDEFYREVCSSKKISIQNFPKHDQWSDSEGFNMEFALAGYSYEDISISVLGQIVTVSGLKNDSQESFDNQSPREVGTADEFDSTLNPVVKMNKGVIVRGIARRNFSVDFFISYGFNLKEITASIKDGLLRITIPRLDNFEPESVKVRQG